MAKPTPRPGLMAIRPYTPGKSTLGERPVHKLSSNESALGPSPMAIAAYQQAAAKISRYPDGDAQALREAIANVHTLDPAMLIIGAGSDEIIQLLIKAYCGEGDHILQTRHAFSYYAIAAAAGGAEPILVDEDNLTADVDALLVAVTDRTRLVFLANPNNPTGTMLRAQELRRLRAGLRDDIILVLDGAYAEYVEDPDYTDGHDMVDESIASDAGNVVMMRTFSKIYGLGGLRVGWGYGPDDIIGALHRIRGPFNINSAALAAATAAVQDQEFVAKNKAHNAREIARLAAHLTAQGFEVTPSFGNFVLFKMPGTDEAVRTANALDLMRHLETQGVLVRSAASSHLPGYIRVSVGDEEANNAFLAGLESFSD